MQVAGCFLFVGGLLFVAELLVVIVGRAGGMMVVDTYPVK